MNDELRKSGDLYYWVVLTELGTQNSIYELSINLV